MPAITALMAGASALTVLAAAVLGYVGADHLRKAKHGTITVPVAPAHDFTLPQNPTGLIVDTDAAGQVAGIAVLSGGVDGAPGGSLLVLPPGTAAMIPGRGGYDRLGNALTLGGLDLETQTVQALLQISLDAEVRVDRSGLADLIRPLTPVTVQFDAPVRDCDRYLGCKELFAAGPRQLTADDVVKVFAARDADETEQDLLGRRQSIWKALMGRHGAVPAATPAAQASPASASPGTPSPTTTVAPTPGALLQSIGSGPAAVYSPGLTKVVGTKLEMYRADVADMRLWAAQVMPGRVSAFSSAPRVRIVNPVDPGVAKDAILRLIGFGSANVVSYSETGTPQPVTEIRVADTSEQDAALSLQKNFFPTAKVVQGPPRIENIDVIITLGTQFRDDVLASRPSSSTTTAVTTPPTRAASPNTTATATTKKGKKKTVTTP
jgi:hypothetical protein